MKCMRFGLVCRMVSSKTPTTENSQKITHKMEGDQRNTKQVIYKQKHGRILPGWANTWLDMGVTENCWDKSLQE